MGESLPHNYGETLSSDTQTVRQHYLVAERLLTSLPATNQGPIGPVLATIAMATREWP